MTRKNAIPVEDRVRVYSECRSRSEIKRSWTCIRGLDVLSGGHCKVVAMHTVGWPQPYRALMEIGFDPKRERVIVLSHMNLKGRSRWGTEEIRRAVWVDPDSGCVYLDPSADIGESTPEGIVDEIEEQVVMLTAKRVRHKMLRESKVWAGATSL